MASLDYWTVGAVLWEGTACLGTGRRLLKPGTWKARAESRERKGEIIQDFVNQE